MKKLSDDGFIATWQASDGTVLRTVTGVLPWALEPTTFLFIVPKDKRKFRGLASRPLLSGLTVQAVLKESGFK